MSPPVTLHETACTMLKLISLPLATRVRHIPTGRTAMVVGKPEVDRPTMVLVPLHFEGSTRRELQPTHQLEVLPIGEQFVRRGGRVKAPAGYPLIPIPPAG